MDLIKQHNQLYLSAFLEEKTSMFDVNLNALTSDCKVDFTDLIRYLDKLLNEAFTTSNDTLDALHIHLEDEFTDSQKLLLAEYLLVKAFKYYHSLKDKSNKSNLELEELIGALEATQNRLEMLCPDGASGKNGGNKIWKNWIMDKRNNKSRLGFYKNLNNKSSLKPHLIFNSKINLYNSISQIFEFNPFSVELGSKFKSYNLLNANHSLNEIDINSNEIIDGLESIILFDCERKSIMSNFSFEELNKWNSDFNTNFKKYLIITFGKGCESINNVRNKISSIRERYKIPVDSSYTILGSEIDFSLKRNKKSSTSIEFVGFESSSFWELFLLETSIRELYELRSIKLMNIYSVCFTHEIKDYIIANIFSKNESSELISSITKMAILELTDEDINTLKETLSNILDLIINSQIKSKITNCLKNTSIISNFFGLKKSIKLKTWLDLINPTSNNFLILSYRDQGKYPNYYFPNLLEAEFHPGTNAIAILPNFLFGHHYKWAKYYLSKEYHKYLNHPIRENNFEWTKLKNKIQKQEPELKLNIDWNLENEYSNSEQRETFKIKLKNLKSKTYNISDLFIVSDEKNIERKVVKIDFLMSFENDDDKIFIQNLDEIQENINIYEKIVDRKQQEAELEVIRKQFNLGDESAGRLWKILLKNIVNIDGEEKLYIDLKNHFESKGLKIVSKFHFKNSWINPLSESIAPLSKRVFIELCEYLKIPKIYFVIIQRIRNATKQSSRQSTRQMNQLLKDLFNDGCFDIGKNAREIINNKLSFYKLNHPLDELGIDENYLADNLVTLTELIQPELKLMELETIEKIEQ